MLLFWTFWTSLVDLRGSHLCHLCYTRQQVREVWRLWRQWVLIHRVFVRSERSYHISPPGSRLLYITGRILAWLQRRDVYMPPRGTLSRYASMQKPVSWEARWRARWADRRKCRANWWAGSTQRPSRTRPPSIAGQTWPLPNLPVPATVPWGSTSKRHIWTAWFASVTPFSARWTKTDSACSTSYSDRSPCASARTHWALA